MDICRNCIYVYIVYYYNIKNEIKTNNVKKETDVLKQIRKNYMNESNKLEIGNAPEKEWATKIVKMNLDGTPQKGRNINKFAVPVEVFPNTTLVDNTTYLSIYNNSLTVKMLIKHFLLVATFAGVAAATRSVFKIQKFDTAAPSGGTTLTPVAFDSSKPASVVSELRFEPTGLVTAGVNFLPYWHEIPITSALNYSGTSNIDFTPDDDDCLILHPGEGLAIRAEGVIVAGAGLAGSFYWKEQLI